MSFERRISSLPLYTRNLHMFLTSGHSWRQRGILRGQAESDSRTIEKTMQKLGRPATLWVDRTRLGMLSGNIALKI